MNEYDRSRSEVAMGTGMISLEGIQFNLKATDHWHLCRETGITAAQQNSLMPN